LLLFSLKKSSITNPDRKLFFVYRLTAFEARQLMIVFQLVWWTN